MIIGIEYILKNPFFLKLIYFIFWSYIEILDNSINLQWLYLLWGMD